MARRQTGPDAATVELVLNRDHRACKQCGMRLIGQRGVGWAVHHRKPRRMGGTRNAAINSPANLVALCTPCHRMVEHQRAWAEQAGWLVPGWGDPAGMPVQAGRASDDLIGSKVWVYLRHDGTESEWPPDALMPEVEDGREVLSEATVIEFRSRYGHLLDEAVESAETDLAVLAVDLPRGEAA